MNSDLAIELEDQQSKVRKAYIRFVASGTILRRPNLAPSDAHKAKAIHLEAFCALELSLTKMNRTFSLLYPPERTQDERRRAPRYSSDARRAI